MSDESDKESDDKSKSSRALKVKKFIASKTAGSTAGKKVILHFLGPQGSDLLNALETAAVKDVGEKTAKEMIGGILKLSFKAAVLHDEKLISIEERNRFTEPVNGLVIALFQNLRLDIEQKVDVTNTSLKFAQLEQMVVELLKRHIKQKNIDLATRIFRYFGSATFLDKFFNLPSFRPERTLFARNLAVIMKSRLGEETQSMPKCASRGCKADSLPADDVGLFGGSSYCLEHHREQMVALLASPSIDHFLIENGKMYEPIQDLIRQSAPLHLCQFLVATYNFQISRESIRLIFADELCEKYLIPQSRCPVKVSQSTIDKILQTLKVNREQRVVPGVLTFADARGEVMAVLHPIFVESIQNTEAYRKYVRTRTIPDELVNPSNGSTNNGGSTSTSSSSSSSSGSSHQATHSSTSSLGSGGWGFSLGGGSNKGSNKGNNNSSASGEFLAASSSSTTTTATATATATATSPKKKAFSFMRLSNN